MPAPARRSARTASTASAAVKAQPSSPAKGSLGAPEKPRRSSGRRSNDVKAELDQSSSNGATSPPKRKRVKKEEDGEGEEAATPKKRTPTKAKKEDPEDATPSKSLAQRKLESHARSHGQTPYPRWPAPSPAESDHVAWLLGRHHGYTPESEGGSGLPHYTPPSGGEGKFAGCGDVQDVLEATIRTILSCNTSGKNSRAAHQSMVAAFGWNDWPRVLAAPEGELEEALRCGGLAKTKARNIQLLLAQTKERFGSLSLQHLHEASDAEVLETLLSFKGCGPKVASCVALFCLGRPEMAVDAHIFRLSKALGWVPPNASRETTYYHLNERIPRHLRYPLHVLLIQHGKACPNCTAKGGSGGDKSICPLKKEGLLGRKMKLLPEDVVDAGKEEEDEEVKDEKVKKEEE